VIRRKGNEKYLTQLRSSKTILQFINGVLFEYKMVIIEVRVSW